MFGMGLSRGAFTLPRSLWAVSMLTLSVTAQRFILSYFIDFLRLCQWVEAHRRTLIIMIYPNCTEQQKRTLANLPIATYSLFTIAYYLKTRPVESPQGGKRCYYYSS